MFKMWPTGLGIGELRNEVRAKGIPLPFITSSPALAQTARMIAKLARAALEVTDRQTLELWIASTTASVTSLVVAVPPTSGVRMPAPVTFSTARISRTAASASPR